ncbi:tRNA pseudouridine(38-40) synthase TruA [Sporosalibacterium faouarense]|uniref:tRNA pseudouridine(38-40) synthase TruA n=1 Tax=Sporosalibacterium faouarense TaxID=516123 RepID=UPI00141D54F8|nr:tRNA pseudouridine(38-40) synthase TruA [Sporosalibacterium faouarense]MTI47440.1 tRNA pseudouridine(38-40) synthase TruA [Bacillota bacterium]
MRNIKLLIKYDGSKYKGWQRLKNSDKSIQQKIEETLSRITQEDIKIIGSGRTDAGVHAIGQVANFKTNSDMILNDLQDYLNIYLPQDIVIGEVKEVHDRFHSRYNAIRKTYLYKIWNEKYRNPFVRNYSEHINESLNVEAMEKGAKFLVGENDFSSFVTSKSKKKSNVRTIYSIDITKSDGLIEIKIVGNGFLYNMVRIIVGTLIEVGKGNLKPQKVNDILKKKNRQLAGPTASAQGLYLVEVEY